GNENFGVRVYVGTGTGIWTDASTNLPTTGAYYSVWMDDVNHDNYTDLVAAGSGMHVWLGNGAGVWTEASNGLPWTDMWSGVTLGDINLDGHLDIAASMDMSGHGLRAWLGDGTSNWTAASAGLPTNGLYYGVVLADLVGDKYPDMLVAGYSGTTAVEIWEGNGGASWTKYAGTLPIGKVIGVAAGDIDNNGYMDIGAAGEGFGVRVWKNDATMPPLRVEVDAPNGGEQWIVGSQYQINWTASGGTPPLTIRIEYSTEGLFGQYTIVSDGESDDGDYVWDIPNNPSIDCFVRVNVTDSTLLTNFDKSNFSFTIPEITPPIISNQQPLNESIISNSQPVITANYSDVSGIDTSSVVLEVDSVDVTALATISVTGVAYIPTLPLADGVHDVYLEVKDSSPNQNKAKSSWWFRVDTQPPAISSERPTNQTTTADPTPSIGASYSDASGVDMTSVILIVDSNDVTASATVTPSDVFYTPLATLADGMHNVSLHLNDNSTPANTAKKSWWFIVETVIVDTTPPNITDLQPPDQSIIENSLPTIGAGYDDLSGIDTGSVYLEVGSIDVTSSSTVTPFGVTYVPPSPLTEGIHNVYLALEDDSPNHNEAEASWSFEVNSLPPHITDLQPLNESLIIDNTPAIGASYTDGSGIDTNSVVLKVDSIDMTSLATITATTITYTPTTLSEGHHDVYLEVGDQSGQQKISTVTWWFTVDTIKPTVTNVTPPAGSILSDDDPVISADYYDESGIDDFSIVWEFNIQDSGAEVPGEVTLFLAGLRFTPDSPLSDDVYCAHLEVSDGAGNRASADWCFTTDTTAPVISNPQPADQSNVSTATPVISATYTDETGINVSSVVLKVDGIDVTGSTTITGTGATFSLASGLSDGLHSVYLYVEDVVPSTPNSASITWNFTIVTDQTDTDDDGLPDDWEIGHFGDLTQGPGVDTDSDGLTNLQELNSGTNPVDPDTDDDGYLDGDDPDPLVAEDAPSAGVDPLLLAVIIIVVVLVLLLIWFFVLKRKKEDVSEELERRRRL
ncbi:MAG: VCBS repeat-containing protein, partial [Thermoplasmata archaeon]|nr:VCBS repeat-containing protein [Thermoplasmata archaeon]